MSHNPEMLRRLRDTCSDYRAGRLRMEELQSVVYQTERDVTAYDERELRKLLRSAENELELIRFTVNEEGVRESAMQVVIRIEQAISRWEPNL